MTDIREQLQRAVAEQLADILADLPEGAEIEITLDDDDLEEDDHGKD